MSEKKRGNTLSNYMWIIIILLALILLIVWVNLKSSGNVVREAGSTQVGLTKDATVICEVSTNNGCNCQTVGQCFKEQGGERVTCTDSKGKGIFCFDTPTGRDCGCVPT
ncbi:MAG: hypothetical protein KKB31_06680 [Nanoarchaeota archaeon]|nr:hypothetical protein [Nanoarchaeota archaeon]